MTRSLIYFVVLVTLMLVSLPRTLRASDCVCKQGKAGENGKHKKMDELYITNNNLEEHYILDMIQRFAGRKFESSFKFSHSPMDDHEVDAWNAGIKQSKEKCGPESCLVECTGFVLEESGGRASRLAMYEFLDGILTRGQPLAVLSKNFSWMPVSSQISHVVATRASPVSFPSLAPSKKSDSKDEISDPTSARSLTIEAGGGSGFGFQMYCDDEMILTAGVGGGGGFNLNSVDEIVPAGFETTNCNALDNSSSNYGGGGGGGIQFKTSFVCKINEDGTNKEDAKTIPICDAWSLVSTQDDSSDNTTTWLDIGGGGGCQSLNPENDDGSGSGDSQGNDWRSKYGKIDGGDETAEFWITGAYEESKQQTDNCDAQVEKSVTCQFTNDASTDRYQSYEYMQFLTKFSSRLRHSCKVIEVFGGGGGGGGTADCCAPYMVGYGFAFAMSSRNTITSVDTSSSSIAEKALEPLPGISRRVFPPSSEADKNTVTVRASGKSIVSTESDIPESRICASDLFSDQVFNFIANSRVCAGGYSNWSCVCSTLRDRQTDCIQQQQAQQFANASNEVNTGERQSSKLFSAMESLWLLQFVCSPSYSSAGKTENAQESAPSLAVQTENYRKYSNMFENMKSPILEDEQAQRHCDDSCCVRIGDFGFRSYPQLKQGLETAVKPYSVSKWLLTLTWICFIVFLGLQILVNTVVLKEPPFSLLGRNENSASQHLLLTEDSIQQRVYHALSSVEATVELTNVRLCEDSTMENERIPVDGNGEDVIWQVISNNGCGDITLFGFD
jgi:hypothetical protein